MSDAQQDFFAPLGAYTPGTRADRKSTKAPVAPDYAAEWLAYRAAHPQVFAEFMRLARAELAAGATYVSAKGVWEQLRRWCKVDRAGTYKLDNNHVSSCAADARAEEPRLVGVMRTREGKRAA